MSFKGKLNIYQCRDCEWERVTIDRDHGTTPFMIDCQGCGKYAQSRCYRVEQDLKPTHEWYVPDTKEYRKIKNPYVREHIDMGGLLMRPIK